MHESLLDIRCLCRAIGPPLDFGEARFRARKAKLAASLAGRRFRGSGDESRFQKRGCLELGHGRLISSLQKTTYEEAIRDLSHKVETTNPTHERDNCTQTARFVYNYLMIISRKHRAGLPKVAIAYIRASTEEQHLSPDAQRASIEAWATKDGVQVIAWHSDLGVSGNTELEQRPGLLEALAALRAHKAGLLAISRRDRLARDTTVAGLIERAVTRQGARIVSADGLANGDGPADQLLRTILDGAAQYEKALIRQRTKDALKTKRASGYRAGMVPFGYVADETGKLSPNEHEQLLVERIRELRSQGISLRGVVELLRQEGKSSRAEKPLSLTQVARIAKRQ